MHIEENSISRLQDLVGKRVELIAFNISYQGILDSIDNEKGVLKLINKEDYAVLELERIEAFSIIYS